jgi:hypothetical protein
MNTILCAVDGSESADRALDFAIGLAKESHAALAVMAVRLPAVPVRGGSMPILPVEDRVGTRRVSDDAAEKARWAGVGTITVVGAGDPATEIAAEAESLGRGSGRRGMPWARCGVRRAPRERVVRGRQARPRPGQRRVAHARSRDFERPRGLRAALA